MKLRWEIECVAVNFQGMLTESVALGQWFSKFFDLTIKVVDPQDT
jgi:hypothetical protein